MKLNFHNLIIEVTRRCNMECSHCLRGDAQDKDLAIDALVRLLDQVGYISDISFTGGEPSIAPHVLEYILQELRCRDIHVGNFYLATNAKQIDDYFLRTMLNWWLYCDDNEMSALEWSNCYYHQCFCIPEENIKKLSAFKFAGPKHKEDCYEYNEYNVYNPTCSKGIKSSLIADGRAVDMTNNGRDEHINTINFDNYGDGITVEDTIYMTVDGMLIPGCDYSYETMEHEAVQIGSVFQDTPIIKMIENYNARTPEDLTVGTLPEKVK